MLPAPGVLDARGRLEMPDGSRLIPFPALSIMIGTYLPRKLLRELKNRRHLESEAE